MLTGVLLRHGEMDLSAEELARKFGLGTPLGRFDQKSHDALEFFIQAGEAAVTE
jgi:hypothetical protein